MVGRTEKWITTLIDGLDKNVDQKTLAKILEKCGRQCQSRSFIKKAKKFYKASKSTDDFLDKLGKVYKHLHREGDRVYIVYQRCYCSQVTKFRRENFQEHTVTAREAGPKRCLKGLLAEMLK